MNQPRSDSPVDWLRRTGRSALSRWMRDAHVVAIGPVRVVDLEGHLAAILGVAPRDHLVVPREAARILGGDPDQPDRDEPSTVERALRRRPFALERRAGTVATERPAERHPPPEPDRDREVRERLDLAPHDRLEPRRAVGRRLTVGWHRDVGGEQVGDGVDHAAAQAGRRIPDADDPRIERPESDRRSGWPGVREVEAVGARREARNGDVRHERIVDRLRVVRVGPGR